MSYPFKNLIFEGGGVKGVAYGGALDVLDDRGILGQIVRVGGTSAGAITAALVALGYDAAAIKSKMLNLNFNEFKDGSFLRDFKNLFEKYGWYKGDIFLRYIEGEIAHMTGNPHATFNDLHARGFKDLYVISTDLTLRQYQVFSHESKGETRVADAVRMSMSIPLFFASYKFENNVFVDGGVLNNYPITLFDDPKYNKDLSPGSPNPETLGFVLSKQVIEPYKISDM
ncbi:MAG TPA: patatin-like phospholipase family protein, partial [Blastocatellia bacterium]